MMINVKVAEPRVFDVCVCGGGPAGFCAAVAAARNGARTALVERYGALGGAMTVGGIPAPGLFHAHGRQVIAGIGWELMCALSDVGAAKLPQAPYLGRHPEMAVKVNAFQAALYMDRFCAEAGVEVLFHQPVAGVTVENGKIDTLLLATKTGLQAIRAHTFVDCTGDGDVAAMAGVPFEQGQTVQPGSFNLLFAGFDPAQVDREQADALFAQANDEGRLFLQDVWSGRGKRCAAIWNGMGSNLNHVYPLDGADSGSRTDAEVRARESVARLLRWMKNEVPGCEETFVAAVAPETWVRESRRIVGMDTVTGQDYIQGKVSEGAVCYSFYPIDIHTHEKDALINEFHALDKVPGIPYGALVPQRGCANLLVAGRCISGDRAAQSAYRVQASCMAMGQAAGTAAAMAAMGDVGVWDVDVQRLREVLALQGAIVPEV